jgi:protein tyrosine phosphatase (PTP) superfamily phosphohydrolase (DUF442 family)
MTAVVAVVVLAVVVALGNLSILVAHRRARRRAIRRPQLWASTPNSFEVTATLWRSGKPDADGYAAVAAAGARTVVDLRAEGGESPGAALGLRYERIPVRDGQAPGPDSITRLREFLDTSPPPALIHCSAGVGRTGSMLAARLVLDEGWTASAALEEALSVGPPSLEQIDFIRGLPGRLQPRRTAVAISRILDAPRRSWSRARG